MLCAIYFCAISFGHALLPWQAPTRPVWTSLRIYRVGHLWQSRLNFYSDTNGLSLAKWAIVFSDTQAHWKAFKRVPKEFTDMIFLKSIRYLKDRRDCLWQTLCVSFKSTRREKPDDAGGGGSENQNTLRYIPYFLTDLQASLLGWRSAVPIQYLPLCSYTMTVDNWPLIFA